MNCELAHERIVMAAYGELPDDAAHELDRHLATCPGCQKDREQLRALKLLADAYPVQEPDPNLVTRSRLRLEEALDALPPKTWMERLAQRLSNNFASMQAAPVAAALLLLVGAGAGAVAGYNVAQRHAAQEAAIVDHAGPVGPALPNPVEVANISSIVRQPDSEEVEVRYNKVVPAEMTGSLDDPAIRQLLMLASENASSDNVHDNSVELLAAECRLKALEGLQPYVAEDLGVRDAVLEALLNDSDPHIRTAAINVLEPVEADTSVRQVLHTVAHSDRNPQIRLVSRQALSKVPEFQ